MADHLGWLAEHLGILRWFEREGQPHLRVAVPTGENSAAVAIVAVEDVAYALALAVEQVRTEVDALTRRSRLALV